MLQTVLHYVHLFIVTWTIFGFAVLERVLNGFYRHFPFPGVLDGLYAKSSVLRRHFAFRLGVDPEHSKAKTATLGKTAPELIEAAGFRCEQHSVITSDGYILGLQRIVVPPGYNRAQTSQHRQRSSRDGGAQGRDAGAGIGGRAGKARPSSSSRTSSGEAGADSTDAQPPSTSVGGDGHGGGSDRSLGKSSSIRSSYSERVRVDDLMARMNLDVTGSSTGSSRGGGTSGPIHDRHRRHNHTHRSSSEQDRSSIHPPRNGGTGAYDEEPGLDAGNKRGPWSTVNRPLHLQESAAGVLHFSTTHQGAVRLPPAPKRVRSIADSVPNAGRPPVLMQHGLMMCSEAFLASGRDSCLPFLLADAGYDVVGVATACQCLQLHS